MLKYFAVILVLCSSVIGGLIVDAPKKKHPIGDSLLVPQLHSNPSAPVQIYLDFVGAPAQTWGAYSVPITPAYDQDGNPSSFSASELSAINETWARVAEKYSPFNIDVTTVAPISLQKNKNMEVVIGGNGAWSGGTYGGLSYTGSFASASAFLPNVSWVFSQNLSNNAMFNAEAAAHEAGHEFNLNHQSTYSGTALVAEYNHGDSLKAPIMGNSYGSQRGLWWNGPSDVSSTTIQDDMSILTQNTNVAYRTQDHGQTTNKADVIPLSQNNGSASGIIAQSSDTDTFKLAGIGGGLLTINMNVAPFGPMLLGKLELLNSSGSIIATGFNPNSLSQTLSLNVPAGSYYIVATSDGTYGDVGQYSLNVSLTPEPTYLCGAMFLLLTLRRKVRR